ncbi:hypothetical protein RRG08_018044 [Elysia crispata]|uniref:Uncharacterized protein n=1 Tax=Elysia crispata TaxID=231223 RepID=A0AAE1DF60_9GAST|nr:hypothetical protein RRG08_018044 [Elysia crispata]
MAVYASGMPLLQQGTLWLELLRLSDQYPARSSIEMTSATARVTTKGGQCRSLIFQAGLALLVHRSAFTKRAKHCLAGDQTARATTGLHPRPAEVDDSKPLRGWAAKDPSSDLRLRAVWDESRDPGQTDGPRGPSRHDRSEDAWL